MALRLVAALLVGVFGLACGEETPSGPSGALTVKQDVLASGVASSTTTTTTTVPPFGGGPSTTTTVPPTGGGATTTTTVPPTGGGTPTTTTTTPTTVPPTTTTVPPSGSATQFGAGQHRVGTDIAAGRYYSNPPTSGCFWRRTSGFGGTFDEILANDSVAFDSAQVIVDILPSDAGFFTTPECGTWFNTPRDGAQNSIVAGTWLVGAQLTPGTYVTTAAANCFWRRTRDFTGAFSAIIANNFVSAPGQQLVTIAAGDVGFFTTPECGTWTRTNAALGPAPAQSPEEIRRNDELYRQRNGR